MFQVGFYGQPHVYHALCGAARVHVRVDAVSGDTVADIIGNGHGIAFGGKDSFQGEGLRGRFVIGGHGVVTHQHQVSDGAIGRDDQLSRLRERSNSVHVVSLECAGDMDNFLAVDNAQHIARDAGNVGTGHFGFAVLQVFHELDLRVQ